jgi:hypothetical protein
VSAADDALQRALAEACLREQSGGPPGEELASFLAAEGVDRDDIDAILARPAPIAVYRSLVRNGLSGVVARVLSRTRARMNRASDGRFDRDFATFVDRVGPRTHYLRDVPSEFLSWALPHWRADAELPAYLVDLAIHERTTFQVGAAPDPPAMPPPAILALECALVFHPSATVVRYAHRVHELSDAVDADDRPGAGDVALLAYRDAEHAVRWLDLTPLAAAILERLLAGAALGDALTAACTATEAAADRNEVALLLTMLGARGVILGTRAAS